MVESDAPMDDTHQQAFFRLAALLPRHLVKRAVQGHHPSPGAWDCWTGAALTVEVGTEADEQPGGRRSFLQGALAGSLFRYEGRILEVSGRILRAFFPARARETGPGPARERSDAGLEFATQRAVEAARGVLQAARAAWGEGMPAAAGIAVGEIYEAIGEGGGRQALVLSGEPPRAATRMAASASVGEVLLDAPAFRAVEEHARGESGEHGILLRDWRADVRETRRVPPQTGDYAEAPVKRAMESLLPLVPACCQAWVLEGRDPGPREFSGALASIGFEADEKAAAPEDLRDAALRLAGHALEGLTPDEEVLGAGDPPGSGACVRLLLPGGRARAEEIAARIPEGPAGLPVCRTDLEEGTFRLSLEGVDERRWLRVDRLPGEWRG